MTIKAERRLIDAHSHLWQRLDHLPVVVLVQHPCRNPRIATILRNARLVTTMETRKISCTAKSLPLLPAWHSPHVRQVMRDALVTIDAGLFAVEQETFMSHRSARGLLAYV